MVTLVASSVMDGESWNQQADLLEPAPYLWLKLTYYNGGHDESWNQQAYLLEPAVGFVAYGGVRVHDEAGTSNSHVATAAATSHHCWNHQFFCWKQRFILLLLGDDDS